MAGKRRGRAALRALLAGRLARSRMKKSDNYDGTALAIGLILFLLSYRSEKRKQTIEERRLALGEVLSGR